MGCEDKGDQEAWADCRGVRRRRRKLGLYAMDWWDVSCRGQRHGGFGDSEIGSRHTTKSTTRQQGSDDEAMGVQVTRRAFEVLDKEAAKQRCDGKPDRQEEGGTVKRREGPLGRVGEGGARWTGWAWEGGRKEEENEREGGTRSKRREAVPQPRDHFFSFLHADSGRARRGGHLCGTAGPGG